MNFTKISSSPDIPPAGSGVLYSVTYLVLRLSACRIQLGAHFINQWPSLSSFVCLSHPWTLPHRVAWLPYGYTVRLYLPPRMMLNCQKGKLAYILVVIRCFIPVPSYRTSLASLCVR